MVAWFPLFTFIFLNRVFNLIHSILTVNDAGVISMPLYCVPAPDIKRLYLSLATLMNQITKVWISMFLCIKITIFNLERNVLQCFDNTVQQLHIPKSRLWRSQTTLGLKMPSWLDTHQVQLAEFASITWSTITNSTVLGLSNLAGTLRFLQPE